MLDRVRTTAVLVSRVVYADIGSFGLAPPACEQTLVLRAIALTYRLHCGLVADRSECRVEAAYSGGRQLEQRGSGEHFHHSLRLVLVVHPVSLHTPNSESRGRLVSRATQVGVNPRDHVPRLLDAPGRTQPDRDFGDTGESLLVDGHA